MSASYSNSKSKPGPVYDNFLEALRDLGRGTVNEFKSQAKKAITADVPESFGLSKNGTIQPNESVSMAQIDQAEKRGAENADRQFEARLRQMQQEERSRLLKEESESKQQIKVIQEEIRNLAKSVGEFASEIEKATLQAPVKPGVYHRHFFSQLKNVIITLRKNVQHSKEWLATSNARSSKRGHYWGQVQKSGTKFMLSSERYMVTSTG